jgi:hypothetical protein
VSLAVGILVIELSAVFGWMDYGRLRAVATQRWDGPSADFVDDDELSFRRPPNAHWEGNPRSDMAMAFNLPIRAGYTQTFSTDARGFRNRSAMDHADIALIGDSYVEGAYVSDGETAAAQLQGLTGRVVANLGVSGYGPLQELVVLERFALPLAPRMIAWFFFEGNDLDDDERFEGFLAYRRGVRSAPVPEPWGDRWRRVVGRSLTMNAFIELRQVLEPVIPNAVDSFGWFRDGAGTRRRMYFYDFYATRTFGDYERERFETTKSTFVRAQAICRAHGVRLLVVYVPIKFRVYGDLCAYPPGSRCLRWKPWDLEARFEDFCRSSDIDCLSLTGPMHQAAADGAVLYAPEDSHWSPAGQAFVAKLLSRVVDFPQPGLSRTTNGSSGGSSR